MGTSNIVSTKTDLKNDKYWYLVGEKSNYNVEWMKNNALNTELHWGSFHDLVAPIRLLISI